MGKRRVRVGKSVFKVIAWLGASLIGMIFLVMLYLLSPLGSEHEGTPFVYVKGDTITYYLHHYYKPPEKMERVVERIISDMKEKHPEAKLIVIEAGSMAQRHEKEYIRATYVRERGEFIDFEKSGWGKNYQKQISLSQSKGWHWLLKIWNWF